MLLPLAERPHNRHCTWDTRRRLIRLYITIVTVVQWCVWQACSGSPGEGSAFGDVASGAACIGLLDGPAALAAILLSFGGHSKVTSAAIQVQLLISCC